MLKEIKIIDETGNKIEPVNNLIILPFKNQNEFITAEMAKNIICILKGQLNILEAQKIVSKTGNGKHTTHIDRKTGCST